MMPAYQLAAPTLSDLLAGLVSVAPWQDCSVSSVAANSRELTTGSLFLACSGMNSHGLDHLSETQAQACCALVAEPDKQWSANKIRHWAGQRRLNVLIVDELSRNLARIAARFYAYPSQDMRLTGITGTNGKSSCAWYLAQLGGAHCAMIGTLGVGRIDDLEVSTHTTPDAMTLQKNLAGLRDKDVQSVAIEVSSHALDQQRVNTLLFKTAVFTNLSRDHLDYHADMHSYGEAKARLFQMPGLQNAVLNADDEVGCSLLKKLPPQVTAVLYSVHFSTAELKAQSEHWISARNIEYSLAGTRMQIQSSWGTVEVSTSLLGEFNVSNLLAVMAVRLLAGDELRSLAVRVAQLSMPPGRLQRLQSGTSATVLIDYAHTPDALQNVMKTLRQHVEGKLFVVFGCGGERDRGKRPLMGAAADWYADYIVLTDDNPRAEDAQQIIADIRAGIAADTPLEIQHDRRAAIAAAIDRAGTNDLVLVAGKGHENYQLIDGQSLPFSDAAVVAGLLQQQPEVSL